MVEVYNSFMSKSVLFGLSNQILLDHNKSIKFKARGSSMRPYIKDGDIVEVEPVNHSQIKKGDILLFRGDLERLYLHRILKTKGNEFVLKGDSSKTVDGVIGPEKIIGRLISITKKNTTIKVNSSLSSLFSLSWAWYGLRSFIFNLAKPGIKCLQQTLLGLPTIRKASRNIIGDKIPVSVANPEDSYDICVFYQQYGLDAVKETARQIQTGEASIILATFRGKLIGCGTVAFDPRPGQWNGWWLSGVLVSGKFRGFGVGEKIVSEAIRNAKDGDACSLKLLAFEQHKPAVDLYTKLGFDKVKEPEIENFLKAEAGADGASKRIFMVKKLK